MRTYNEKRLETHCVRFKFLQIFEMFTPGLGIGVKTILHIISNPRFLDTGTYNGIFVQGEIQSLLGLTLID